MLFSAYLIAFATNPSAYCRPVEADTEAGNQTLLIIVSAGGGDGLRQELFASRVCVVLSPGPVLDGVY
jgi:hypothetical protein